MKLAELLNLISSTAKKERLSKPYLVGGMVRDIYLRRFDDIKDIDITCGDSTSDVLGQVLVGKLPDATYTKFSDGHGRLRFDKYDIDFSNNYNVPNIDGELYKLGIRKASSLEKEIYSRDFTMNSMLMPLDLSNIIDLTQRGISDIGKKTVDTCLAPEITLESDPRRIVRVVYLCAKLSFVPSQRVLLWVKNNNKKLIYVDEQYTKDKINKAIDVNPELTFDLLSKMEMHEFVPSSKRYRDYLVKKPETLYELLSDERKK